MIGRKRAEGALRNGQRLNADTATRLQHGCGKHIGKARAFLVRQERSEPGALIPHRKRQLNRSVRPLNARQAHPRRIKRFVSAVATSIDLREPNLFVADGYDFTATRICKVPTECEYD